MGRVKKKTAKAGLEVNLLVVVMMMKSSCTVLYELPYRVRDKEQNKIHNNAHNFIPTIAKLIDVQYSTVQFSLYCTSYVVEKTAAPYLYDVPMKGMKKQIRIEYCTVLYRSSRAYLRLLLYY
jgi:hypothetical protein